MQNFYNNSLVFFIPDFEEENKRLKGLYGEVVGNRIQIANSRWVQCMSKWSDEI